MGKFVVKETKTGVKFDLKAGNGQVIATSEVYTTEAACLKGIESVKKNAVDDSFTLEEFFDDIVCHVIIETFDGHQAEKELMNVLTRYGYDVEETEGDMDAEYGVDLIVRKNGEFKEFIQVKPLSTFVRTNPSLIEDRSHFFMKQLKLDEFIEKNETNLKRKTSAFTSRGFCWS